MDNGFIKSTKQRENEMIEQRIRDDFTLATFQIEVDCCGITYFVTNGEGDVHQDKTKAFKDFTYLYAKSLIDSYGPTKVIIRSTEKDDDTVYVFVNGIKQEKRNENRS